MRVGNLSDLHLEHLRTYSSISEYISGISVDEDLDVLCLTGDIWSAVDSKMVSLAVKGFRRFAKEIVYIPGNHDWYGTGESLNRSNVLRHIQDTWGVHVLSRFTQMGVNLNGQHFCGTTLWYPKNPTTEAIVRIWSDNSSIASHRKWWPEEFLQEEIALSREVQAGSIVLTHMLPSFQLVYPAFAGNLYNPVYVSPVEDILQYQEPKIWFFGHTHNKIHKKLWNVDCYSNPIGYPSLNLENPVEVLVLEV
jgi:predicted MPP superfamily phosphohydrolase